MNRTSQAILILAVVLVCWAVYAVLAIAAEHQRLSSGDGYGELYGPLAWLRDRWLWVGVAISVLSVAALPVVLLRRSNSG